MSFLEEIPYPFGSKTIHLHIDRIHGQWSWAGILETIKGNSVQQSASWKVAGRVII